MTLTNSAHDFIQHFYTYSNNSDNIHDENYGDTDHGP